MQRSPVRIASLVSVAMLFLLVVSPAESGTLDDAKAAGHVGERPDGTVGIVHADAPDDVRKLVAEVNTKRRQGYESIARKNGIPVDAVAVQAGTKLIGRARPGEYVMRTDGTWVKKK